MNCRKHVRISYSRGKSGHKFQSVIPEKSHLTFAEWYIIKQLNTKQMQDATQTIEGSVDTRIYVGVADSRGMNSGAAGPNSVFNPVG